MRQIKKEPKKLNVKIERVLNPPKLVFGFQYLHHHSWTDCKNVDFFKEFIARLQKFSQLTWQALYQAPRHGLGTEKMPLSSMKPLIQGLPEGIDNLLVLRATGNNHPFLGFRVADTFEVVFIESEFGDVYEH